ncbi:MAG: efflux RND transporter periplasmic adaptor subunit [Saprospiraceae bacterium]|nr:efflux RND transporter periplasmic adaptor subunit [Saprospiraceae bacterium]
MKYKYLLLCTSLLILSCKDQNQDNPEPTAKPSIAATVEEGNVEMTDNQIKNSTIEIGALVKKSMTKSLKVNGFIQVPPQNLISINMPLGGYVSVIKVLPGMNIKKGELIATMEDQQYIQLQQEYLTLKSKLLFAEKEYNRQKELNMSQASSTKIYEQSQAEVEALKINIKALSEKLKLININPSTLTVDNISKRINIHAPVSGRISNVNVNVGKFVSASDVICEIINPSDVLLKLNVFENDIPFVHIGQQVMAFTNDNPDKKYPAVISLISSELSADHSAEVLCRFTDANAKLLAGTYMNADINSINNYSLTLPESAIISFEGKNYIFVAKNANNFSMQPVKTGIKSEGMVEIMNATDFTNMSLVTKGAYTLLMKLKNKEE